jgi:hypothetical protein
MLLEESAAVLMEATWVKILMERKLAYHVLRDVLTVMQMSVMNAVDTTDLTKTLYVNVLGL